MEKILTITKWPKSLRGEKWRFVEEDNLPKYRYLVSNLGRIFNLKTGCMRKASIANVNAYELKTDRKDSPSKHYYSFITFPSTIPKKSKRDGEYGKYKIVSYAVHRLVAKAFLPGFQEGLEVDHKNHNGIDNRACNLRWITRRNNVAKITDDTARKILRMIYDGVRDCDITNTLNLNPGTVGNMKHKRVFVDLKEEFNKDVGEEFFSTT